MQLQKGLKMAKNGIFWVATLTNLATLNFSKVIYYTHLTLFNNLLLECFENLLPSRRRCMYKTAITYRQTGVSIFYSNRYIHIYIKAQFCLRIYCAVAITLYRISKHIVDDTFIYWGLLISLYDTIKDETRVCIQSSSLFTCAKQIELMCNTTMKCNVWCSKWEKCALVEGKRNWIQLYFYETMIGLRILDKFRIILKF